MAVSFLLAWATVAAGQSGGIFEIRKSAIVSGSTVSTGGVFSVRGSTGQASVGNMSGGVFEIRGGYYGGGSGTGTGIVPNPELSAGLLFFGNSPNPFNPVTSIWFQLSAPERVSIKIFDVQGRHVRDLIDEGLPRGRNSVMWDGRDQGGDPAASGVYFMILQAGDRRVVHKMTLLK